MRDALLIGAAIGGYELGKWATRKLWDYVVERRAVGGH